MVEFRRSGPNGALLASEHGSPPLQGGPSLSLLALALSPPAAGGDSARASPPRRRGAEFASEGSKSEVVRKSWDKTRICRKTFERADLPAGEAREGGGLAELAVDRAQRSIRAKTPLKSTPFLRGAVLRLQRQAASPSGVGSDPESGNGGGGAGPP